MKKTYKKVVNAYFDESRIDNPNSDFMVFGGLFVDRKYVKEIREGIKSVLLAHDFHAEIKWVKTDQRRENAYKAVIDYVLDLPAYKAAFTCIVVDKTRVDFDRYHDGDAELAFYKFAYQLLKQRIADNYKYYLIFDFKPNKTGNRLQVLRGFLESTIYVDHANTSIIKHMQGYDSKENVLIQVADLFTGAVGYAYNESEQNNKQPKYKLTKYIAEKLNKDSLKFMSTKSEKKFNIFAIDLNKR
jgi:hypothetical protein